MLVVGLLVTAGLAWGDAAIYNRNEARLLKVRTRELGLVLTEAVPTVQTTLVAAALLADTTAGNAARFRAFMGPDVGPGRSFISASLWAPGARVPSAVVGEPPYLESRPAGARPFLSGVRGRSAVSVIAFLKFSPRRLGFASGAPGARNGFVVYVESRLSSVHSRSIPRSSAFNGLHYALYLGRVERPAALIETDLRRLPPRGRTATVRVTFGTTKLTLLTTESTSLSGSFFLWLRWIIAAIGVLFTVAAATLVQRVVQGRRHAEQLAARLDEVAEENRTRYQEQRGIASVLQHALLPDTLASVPGLEVTARYDAEEAGVEIGGDWYELLDVAPGSVLAIVGDVSGHDLQAATRMASLRHAAVSFASLDPSPALVLERLSDLVARTEHDYFATVLCALIDVGAHEVRVATAGHPAPLVIDAQQAEFIELSVGAPVGTAPNTTYAETVVRVGARATLVAFTDGLVERRGEVIDQGLGRLREAAVEHRTLALDDLVNEIARALAPDRAYDDTAILAVRWQA